LLLRTITDTPPIHLGRLLPSRGGLRVLSAKGRLTLLARIPLRDLARSLRKWKATWATVPTFNQGSQVIATIGPPLHSRIAPGTRRWHLRSGCNSGGQHGDIKQRFAWEFNSICGAREQEGAAVSSARLLGRQNGRPIFP